MADFYGTLQGYKDYMTERGRATLLVGNDDAISAALIVGSEVLDGRYLASFQGLKTGGRDQIREWPRTGAYDMYAYPIPSDQVPREVVAATYELAQREIDNPGSLSKDYTPPKYSSATVYGAVSVDYATFGSGAEAQAQYIAVDQILAPLLMGYGGSYSSLSGASVRV